jgi:hypothetical protein
LASPDIPRLVRGVTDGVPRVLGDRHQHFVDGVVVVERLRVIGRATAAAQLTNLDRISMG